MGRARALRPRRCASRARRKRRRLHPLIMHTISAAALAASVAWGNDPKSTRLVDVICPASLLLAQWDRVFSGHNQHYSNARERRKPSIWLISWAEGTYHLADELALALPLCFIALPAEEG